MADSLSQATAKVAGVGTVPIPFDQARLGRAMDRAAIDALLVTSRVNVRYLTGGYHCLFFHMKDELALGRYSPTILYRKTHPDHTLFLGSGMDREQLQSDAIWIPNVDLSHWTGATTAPVIVDWIKKEKLDHATIGVEYPFISAEMFGELQKQLLNVTWVDAVKPLEYLRAVKRPDELAILRTVSEKVVEAMQYGFRALQPGMSSYDLEQVVARKERELGTDFDYCLVGFGKHTNRTPRKDVIFEAGMIADLDSGANIDGYLGDLCRMGSHGEPEPLHKILLQEIDHVQMLARRPIKPGARGGEIFEAAQNAIAECEHGSWMSFVVHGMGLVTHEAPRLRTGVSAIGLAYPNEWAEQPLEAGMVVSIETTIAKPECGFVKLEDTCAVTAHGCEGFGDGGRGWNPIGL